MLSARFVSEGISDFVEVEAAIDDWLNAGSIDASHKIHLMLSTDNQTVKSGLLGHQLSGRDFAGAAGEDADQSDVAVQRWKRRQCQGRARVSPALRAPLTTRALQAVTPAVVSVAASAKE